MNDKGHLYISLIKSFLRILGCVVFFIQGGDIEAFVEFITLAEILGISEELVDKRK